MAITKIMNINCAGQGNLAAQLEHSIKYICNEAKTQNGSLIGGINCLPDFAFYQMIQTKEMFGKTGGRQGYHFVISLLPGEGTKEQMFEIIRRFAEGFLAGEYEAVYSVHDDKDHCHGHLVFNSVNMITGKKYEYKKGDWKKIIQPITNKLCEEYGLSIVPAEYSQNPVNMNRKQWEKEQSWSEFINGDMQYCRSKATTYEEFLFLMEQLGYEIKVGAHIAVKAEAMRRSRRLDTIDAEFTPEQLMKYYEESEKHYSYVAPPVFNNSYPLLIKPKSTYQQKLYGKLYRLQVVQKYRFQHKYTRYKEDLQRMQELQEEYLFLNRKGINGWSDVVEVAEDSKAIIADIDARKKQLYKEHARHKYEYEKSGNEAVFLYQEAYYREQLQELKEQRREAKKELAVATRCMKESLYAHLEIPTDVNVENLYEMDVPRLGIEVTEMMSDSVVEDVKVVEPETVLESLTREMAEIDVVAANLESEMTKELYEKLTDKEKVEWLGLLDCKMEESISLFISKLESIGIVYQYGDDALEEYLRLEAVVAAERREKTLVDTRKLEAEQIKETLRYTEVRSR